MLTSLLYQYLLLSRLDGGLGGEHVSFHALEVVLPLLGRLAVLVQPLLALLALHQQRHLAAVLVLPRQVPRHQRRRVRLPQTLDLALLNEPMQKMNSMELLRMH